MDKPPEDPSTNCEDLLGLVCPRPIAEIIQAVHCMEVGAKRRFLVNDPLAIKAVPEELEEYDDLEVTISEYSDHWEIAITRLPSSA